MKDKSVTWIVRDRVNMLYAEVYEKQLRLIHKSLSVHKGFLTAEMITEESLPLEAVVYTIVYRFQDYEALHQWEQSSFLKNRLAKVSAFLQKPKVESEELIHQRPMYWKQVLITIGAVYPLIILVDWLLRMVFPMHLLMPQLAVLFTVIIVAALVVNPVMPFIAHRVGGWLYRR